jgi:hypothetical protein
MWVQVLYSLGFAQGHIAHCEVKTQTSFTKVLISAQPKGGCSIKTNWI